MQVETNFIRRNETSGLQQCIRSSKIYDAIVCPPGHFRRREEEVLAGCELAGLSCDEGFQCLCRPCVKSFDVDVFPVLGDELLQRDADKNSGQTTVAASDSTTGGEEEISIGCPKMTLCGSIEQTKPIRFRAVDNKKRSGIGMSVLVHAGQSETREIRATPVLPTGNETESFMYDFVIAEERVGVVVLEILAGGKQIPESPLRLEVTPRNCVADNNDPLSEAQADGSCSCAANSVDIGGQCVSLAILLPAIILPILAIAAVALFFYIKRKHKVADSVWHVKEKELEFEDPPQIIGRGTFGLVLLAEYRGTQVAVKRVIPPKHQSTSPNGSDSGSTSTAFDKRYSFLPSDGRSRSSLIAPMTGGRMASLEGIVEGDAESAADASHPGDVQRRKSSLSSIGGMKANFGRSGSQEKIGDVQQKRRLSAYNAFDGMPDDPELGKSSGASNGLPRDSGAYASNGLGSGVIGVASGAFDASAVFGGQDPGMSSYDALSSMQLTPAKQVKNRGRRSSDGRRSNDTSGSGRGSHSGSSSSKKSNWLLKTLGLASNDEYAKLKADFIVEMRHLSKCESMLFHPQTVLHFARLLTMRLIFYCTNRKPQSSTSSLHHHGNGSSHRKGRRTDAYHGVHGHGFPP